MPGLFTPQLSITIDRRRMIADCTIEINIAPLIDGSDRPFPDEFRLEARLENHDTVRLRLLYTFDQRIVRADLNRTSSIGVRFNDKIACSLLNEDKAGADEIVAVVTLFGANNVVLTTARSEVLRIHAMRSEG